MNLPEAMVPARSTAISGQVRVVGDTDPGEISMAQGNPGSAGGEGQAGQGDTTGGGTESEGIYSGR